MVVAADGKLEHWSPQKVCERVFELCKTSHLRTSRLLNEVIVDETELYHQGKTLPLMILTSNFIEIALDKMLCSRIFRITIYSNYALSPVDYEHRRYFLSSTEFCPPVPTYVEFEYALRLENDKPPKPTFDNVSKRSAVS